MRAKIRPRLVTSTVSPASSQREMRANEFLKSRTLAVFIVIRVYHEGCPDASERFLQTNTRSVFDFGQPARLCPAMWGAESDINDASLSMFLR